MLLQAEILVRLLSIGSLLAYEDVCQPRRGEKVAKDIIASDWRERGNPSTLCRGNAYRLHRSGLGGGRALTASSPLGSSQ
jgi:hypothetical protein